MLELIAWSSKLTCTKNLLSILSIVSDFGKRSTMSHSESQKPAFACGTIKYPYLPRNKSVRFFHSVWSDLQTAKSSTLMIWHWVVLARLLTPGERGRLGEREAISKFTGIIQPAVLFVSSVPIPYSTFLSSPRFQTDTWKQAYKPKG